MTPYYERNGITIYCGDCLEIMRSLPDNSIDSIITDPPYELDFMNKKWDGSGIAFNVEVWREALRVAKPGATLMAFGGTRTHHRLACAIEDAGWEIRDCISYFHDGNQQEQALMASLDDEQLAAYLELHYPNQQMSWVYGSGFPKSHDVSKGIDKANRMEREVVGNKLVSRDLSRNGQKGDMAISNGDVHATNISITAPASPLAKKFSGWGSALKPSFEPIIVAMAPLDGTYAQNAEKWAVSGLWIDGSRISTQGDASLCQNNQALSIPDDAYACICLFLRDFYDHILSSVHCYNTNGIVLKRNEVYRDDKLPVPFLCEPCLNRHSPNDEKCEKNLSSIQDFQSDCLVCHHFCDELSRFVLTDALNVQTLRNDVLKCIHPSLNWDALGVISYDSLYCLCTGHLSNCDDVHGVLSRLHSLLKSMSNYTAQYAIPQDKGRYPANTIHSNESGVLAEFGKAGESPSSARPKSKGKFYDSRNNIYGKTNGKYHNSLHDDSGTPARYFAQCPPDTQPARFIYNAKAPKSERSTPGNNHPTQKPLSLIQYLCRLTKTPDGGVVLDLFGGSGTTALACIAEGRECILIEKHPPYVEIIKRRIAEYTGQEIQSKEVETQNGTTKQMSLW